MKPIIYAALICGAMMCVGCGRGNASLATYPKQTITYDLPDPEESKWTQFFDSIHTPNQQKCSFAKKIKIQINV